MTLTEYKAWLEEMTIKAPSYPETVAFRAALTQFNRVIIEEKEK